MTPLSHGRCNVSLGGGGGTHWGRVQSVLQPFAQSLLGQTPAFPVSPNRAEQQSPGNGHADGPMQKSGRKAGAEI